MQFKIVILNNICMLTPTLHFMHQHYKSNQLIQSFIKYKYRYIYILCSKREKYFNQTNTHKIICMSMNTKSIIYTTMIIHTLYKSIIIKRTKMLTINMT